VRAALHAAFVALQAQSTQTFQDWAALVGYVRLLEDYTQYLIDVTLQGDLAALEVTKEWFNPVGGNSRICTIFQEFALAEREVRHVAFGIRLFWD
jgi:hypothetical protein